MAMAFQPGLPIISYRNLGEIDVIDSNNDIMSHICVMVLFGTAVRNLIILTLI